MTGTGWPSFLAFLVVAALWLALRVARRARFRARVVAAAPDERTRRRTHQVMREVMPLVGPTRARGFVYPQDPFALVEYVTVAPLGDGRPGETFRAPTQPRSAGIGPDGSRQDALVPLFAGAYLLVVCLGRIGSEFEGHVRAPAPERCAAAAARADPAMPLLRTSGPHPSAAGELWEVTTRFASGRTLTDLHVDVGEWAFVVGVLSATDHQRALAAARGILDTWVWVPHDAFASPSP